MFLMRRGGTKHKETNSAMIPLSPDEVVAQRSVGSGDLLTVPRHGIVQCPPVGKLGHQEQKAPLSLGTKNSE